MEYIDIRDQEGNLTGIVKEREEVHRDGDLHATSHVWIARRTPEKTLQVHVKISKYAEEKNLKVKFVKIDITKSYNITRDFIIQNIPSKFLK